MKEITFSPCHCILGFAAEAVAELKQVVYGLYIKIKIRKP